MSVIFIISPLNSTSSMHCLISIVGAPVMMRYPPPEMMATMGPNGMMMHQRPMGMDPQMMHYSAVGREAGLNEGTPLILSSTDSSCTLLIQ